MKKNEKKTAGFEKIKERIKKETGYYIKNLNPKNARKELEKFIYVMASYYNDCWVAISDLEEIETYYSVIIRDDRKSEIARLSANMIGDIFQDEEIEYSDALDGILKLAIDNNYIYNILKEDIPALEKIREIFKDDKQKKYDYAPIYVEIDSFYLCYMYDMDINKFIRGLNEELTKIINDKKIIEKCFLIEEKTINEQN